MATANLSVPFPDQQRDSLEMGLQIRAHQISEVRAVGHDDQEAGLGSLRDKSLLVEGAVALHYHCSTTSDLLHPLTSTGVRGTAHYSLEL